jgi:hypothetical protein
VTISGGRIGGSVISSTSTISVSGNSTVYGGAKAASSITVSNPATVNGTQSPNTSGIGSPPALTYPTYTYSASDWTPPGVSPQTSCANATTAISTWTTGDLYIRLTAGTGQCNLQSKVLPGNLAILTDGGITFPSNTKFTTTTGTHTVYLFTGMTGSCGDVISNSNSGIVAPLKVLLFTPSTCSTTINSNSWNASGQLFSGTVNFNSNSAITYAPISLPNTTGTGSLIDIVYKREVTS